MRIANAMLIRPAMNDEPVTISPGMQVALVITAVATLYIGIFPNFFINAAGSALGIQQVGSSMLGFLR